MAIHPIKGFKELPTSKKIAVIGGTLATVALATTAVAYGKGKKVLGDQFVADEKITKKVKQAVPEGFSAIGNFIKSIPSKIKGLFSKNK